MKEKTALKHLKENKHEGDYVLVYDLSLKGQVIKAVEDLILDEETIGELVSRIENMFNNHSKKIIKLESELEKQRVLLEKIVKGLNLR